MCLHKKMELLVISIQFCCLLFWVTVRFINMIQMSHSHHVNPALFLSFSLCVWACVCVSLTQRDFIFALVLSNDHSSMEGQKNWGQGWKEERGVSVQQCVFVCVYTVCFLHWERLFRNTHKHTSDPLRTSAGLLTYLTALSALSSDQLSCPIVAAVVATELWDNMSCLFVKLQPDAVSTWSPPRCP